ncbi:hypothetical protein WISP_14329 [Willisornis vidua]|uniref:Uncharacterized protein n=1 Tax=Willisornis vidua TaxID=1566151 RepID=A0ABQ9DTD8_9PASS|nr:hypothetical protein WISP_14329 [Willisornis vidua]
MYERNRLEDAKGDEEEGGGGGGDPGTQAVIPLMPVVQTMVRQLFPADHGGPQGSRDLPATSGGPYIDAGGCLKEEAVTQWEACPGVGSWQDL